MKAYISLAFLAVGQAIAQKWSDVVDATVTEVITRTYYTCPCDGKVSLATSTSTYSGSWVDISSYEYGHSSSGTTSSGTDPYQTTTASLVSSTSQPQTSSTLTTTSVTTTSSSPTITEGQTFVLTAQIAASSGTNKLIRRDAAYIQFIDQAAYLQSDSSLSAQFEVTDGTLFTTTSSGSQVEVGSDNGASGDVLKFYDATGTGNGLPSSWSVGASGLTFPNLSFCVLDTNEILIEFGSDTTVGCTTVVLTAVTDSECPECFTAGSDITTTSQTTTATSTTSSTATTTTPSSCKAVVPDCSASPVTMGDVQDTYTIMCQETVVSYSDSTYSDSFTDCIQQCTQSVDASGNSNCKAVSYDSSDAACASTAPNCFFVYSGTTTTFEKAASSDVYAAVKSGTPYGVESSSSNS